MRIYSNCEELMSEMGRNLWEMGKINKPKTYQNKNIEGNDEYATKELIAEQYCLTSLNNMEALFFYSHSKEWADDEFKERVKTPIFSPIDGNPDRYLYLNPGEAYLKRKDIWDEFLTEKDKFDYTYNERMTYTEYHVSNLEHVMKELDNNPDTRRAILPIFDINDTQLISEKIRIPCSMYYNFLIRENQKGEKVLNIIYHQRSSDFITHFGNDVYLAYKLMDFISKHIMVKPGYLFHTLDSIHVYKKDFELLKSGLNA